MKLQFDAIPVTELPNFQGGEGVFRVNMYTDELGKIIRGRLAPGTSIGMHTHEDSSETVYVLSGAGKAICDGREERLGPGDCHYCPQGHSHSIINDSAAGDLVFVAVVPVHAQ